LAKTQKKSQRRYTFDVPEVINMDELALFTDEDLAKRANVLEVERQKVGAEAVPWEVELAYIQREQGIREFGGQLHADYLRKVPADEPRDG
jgi:hypothetical protein